MDFALVLCVGGRAGKGLLSGLFSRTDDLESRGFEFSGSRSGIGFDFESLWAKNLDLLDAPGGWEGPLESARGVSVAGYHLGVDSGSIRNTELGTSEASLTANVSSLFVFVSSWLALGVESKFGTSRCHKNPETIAMTTIVLVHSHRFRGCFDAVVVRIEGEFSVSGPWGETTIVVAGSFKKKSVDSITGEGG